MGRVTITAKIIAAAIAEAKTTRKTVERWDTAVTGLHLRVSFGGTATYYLRYRVGKTSRRLKIGRATDLPITRARDIARERWSEIYGGADPAAERAKERDAQTLGDLLKWYLDEHSQTAGRLGTSKTDAAIASDRYRIAKHLDKRQALVRTPIATLTTAALRQVKRATTASTWRQLRSILSVCLRHAVREGMIDRSPLDPIDAVPARKMARYLTPDERAKIDAALATVEPHYQLAIRLLALTGMRRGDALALQWEHIDWERALARLPTGKTGARDVPLSPQAIALLEESRRDSGYVVCAPSGARPRADGVTHAWIDVRAAAGLSDVRLHDLRHSWASDAVSAGVPLYVVGAVLGHRQPSTTARYSHLHDEAIRDGVAKAGRAIAASTTRRHR